MVAQTPATQVGRSLFPQFRDIPEQYGKIHAPIKEKKKKITKEYLSSKNIIHPTLHFSKIKSLRNQESAHKERKVGRTAYSFIMK